MTTNTMNRLTRALLLAGLVAMGAGVSACDDDDDNDNGADGSPDGSGDGGDGVPTDGEDGAQDGDGGDGEDDAGVPEADVDSAAADLRVTVNLLLSEHIVFAAKATGAALGGRTEEFGAYQTLLNENGLALGALVGSAYGDTAETSFNAVWGAHNGYFVQYTTAVAEGDETAAAAAVTNLTDNYVPMFSGLLVAATGLPAADVTALTMEHVVKTKAIVDAQAAEDWPAAYAAIRDAFAHMQHLGDPISGAVAAGAPEAFPGDGEAAGPDFRVALNQLLQEHLYLASFATGAALGERIEEFNAAGAALGTNGTDLGGAIGLIYGDAAETSFNDIWSAHNTYFVAYTTGVATDDEAAKTEAVNNLTTVYVPEFATFLAGATDLPEDALTALISHHVATTKAIVDLQAGTDFTATAEADHAAGKHMQMIGDPLASAIVAKNPDKF